MGRTHQISTAVGWGAGLRAGAGAGLVAGVAAVATVVALHAQAPPPVPAFGSAFTAGVLGGVVYAWWSRVVRRPARALLATALVLATVDSIIVAALPAPAGRGTPTPFIGLLFPLRQLAALVGVGHFASGRIHAPLLSVLTTLHYVTAVLVSVLIPRWASRG